MYLYGYHSGYRIKLLQYRIRSGFKWEIFAGRVAVEKSKKKRSIITSADYYFIVPNETTILFIEARIFRSKASRMSFIRYITFYIRYIKIYLYPIKTKCSEIEISISQINMKRRTAKKFVDIVMIAARFSWFYQKLISVKKPKK